MSSQVREDLLNMYQSIVDSGGARKSVCKGIYGGDIYEDLDGGARGRKPRGNAKKEKKKIEDQIKKGLKKILQPPTERQKYIEKLKERSNAKEKLVRTSEIPGPYKPPIPSRAFEHKYELMGKEKKVLKSHRERADNFKKIGGKRKRRPSQWNLFVKKYYKDPKNKGKGKTLADARKAYNRNPRMYN